jgi:hypothetical protein
MKNRRFLLKVLLRTYFLSKLNHDIGFSRRSPIFAEQLVKIAKKVILTMIPGHILPPHK